MEVYYNSRDDRYIVILNDEWIMSVSKWKRVVCQLDTNSIRILRSRHLGDTWVLL